MKGRRVPEAYVPLDSWKIPLWIQCRQYDLVSVKILENLWKSEFGFFSMSHTKYVNFLNYITIQYVDWFL